MAGMEIEPASPMSPASPKSMQTTLTQETSRRSLSTLGSDAMSTKISDGMGGEIVPVNSSGSQKRRTSGSWDSDLDSDDPRLEMKDEGPIDPSKLKTFTRLQLLGSYFGFSVSVLWMLLVVVMLFFFTLFYTGPGVDVSRKRYAAAAAHRVGIEAASVLTGAMSAVSAVAYSIERKRFFEPMDFAGARAMLEPTFSAVPSLRAVDLAFTNRTTSMRLSRVINGYDLDPGILQGPKPVTTLVQSDVEDCLDALGPLGCLGSKPPAFESEWYEEGLTLHAGMENEPSNGPNEAKHLWLNAPVFVDTKPSYEEVQKAMAPEPPQDDEPAVVATNWWDAGKYDESNYELSCATVPFTSALQLVFRVPLPGTLGYVSCIGRVTLEVDALRTAGVLVDRTALGEGGIILLCDHFGHVLAHILPGQQAFVEGGSGMVRPRLVWELDYAWAKHLDAATLAMPAQFQGMEAEGFHVALESVTGDGMERFVIVVAAARDSFVDLVLEGLGWTAISFVWLPAPAALMIFGLRHLYEMLNKRRKLKRVHPVPKFSGNTAVAQAPMI